jgi:signal transduction histidine kinase
MSARQSEALRVGVSTSTSNRGATMRWLRLDPRGTAASAGWEHGLPEWVFVGAALWATLLGGICIVIGGSRLGPAVEFALVVLAVSPWWVKSAWESTSIAAAAATLVPATVLALTGTTPICLGLLALGAARWAVFGAMWTSLLYALAAIGVVIVSTLLHPGTAWFVWKSYVELGVALGWALHASRLRVLRERDNASLLAERAVADERCRIARDVHDAIAHSLSVMLLHLNGAQLLVDEDPDEVREALDEAISEGRRSLDEVRHVVGLLGSARSSAPVTAADIGTTIEQLVASYQRAGLEVTLDLHLDASDDDVSYVSRSAVWSAVYRITQESLANAVRHAPGAAVQVMIAAESGAVVVQVANAVERTGNGSEVGNGVAGMRERVRMLGGSFSCGSVADVWIVECSLPLAPVPVARRLLTAGRR